MYNEANFYPLGRPIAYAYWAQTTLQVVYFNENKFDT